MKAITRMIRQLAARAGVITVFAVGAFFADQNVKGQSAEPTSGPPLHLYEVLDLGTLGGGFTESHIGGINSRGQIAGFFFNASFSDFQAVSWASPRRLPIVLKGGDGTDAMDINGRGAIIGTFGEVAASTFHALVWANSNSLPQTLRGPGGGLGYNGISINDHGQMVGNAFSDADPNFLEALFWANPHSLPVPLIGVPGLNNAGPGLSNTGFPAGHTINNAGQMVGTANDDDDTVQHAIFWADSTRPATELGSVGELNQGGATAINNVGDIVGVAYNNDSGITHGALWDTSGSPPIDLGALDEQLTSAEALGINDHGQIVGDAYNADFSIDHAVYWPDALDAAIDLNNLIPTGSGWVLQEATDINSSGVIVGYGIIGGHTHCFALVPKGESAEQGSQPYK